MNKLSAKLHSMKKKLIFHTICLSTLINLVSCSSLLYTDTNIQQNSYNNRVLENENIKNDILFNLNWTLISIKINAYENLSFPVNGSYSTLKFLNNGNYSGKAICNSFFGKFTLLKNNIKFANTIMTRVGCDNIKEDLIINTLNDINNFSVNDKKLYLKRNKEVLMIYKLN